MKKAIVLITLVLTTITLTGCGCQRKTEEKKKTIEQQVENGTLEKQGDFRVTDLKIKAVGTKTVVSGKVKNNSKRTQSISILLQLTNSDKAQLLGVESTTVENLEAGKTQDFSLSIVGDYTTVNNYEIKVTEI